MFPLDLGCSFSKISLRRWESCALLVALPAQWCDPAQCHETRRHRSRAAGIAVSSMGAMLVVHQTPRDALANIQDGNVPQCTSHTVPRCSKYFQVELFVWLAGFAGSTLVSWEHLQEHVIANKARGYLCYLVLLMVQTVYKWSYSFDGHLRGADYPRNYYKPQSLQEIYGVAMYCSLVAGVAQGQRLTLESDRDRDVGWYGSTTASCCKRTSFTIINHH